ncbi:MAG: envelope stress response membrane protein PspC [Inquilinaceae bacterium]
MTTDARSGDPLYTSQNPHRLYRDPANGVLFGVCAGLADYLGVRRVHVRLGAFVALLIFTPQTLFVYVLAAILLRRKPAQIYRTDDEERFWRSVSSTPRETFGTLRHRFRELDQRLAAMEGHVTSDEYRLDREIRDLNK